MKVRRIAAIGALVAIGALTVLPAGCGGGGDEGLVVLGASSLQGALSEYAASYRGADVKPSFAGSDRLAAQIRRGAHADLFAAADTAYPARLFAEGLVDRPRPFAANSLVVAVPAGSDVSSLADLAAPGVEIAIGDAAVPVGAYTRTVLGRLPARERRAIVANVRSEEPDVGSVIAKVAQGAADAGFVYATDARAAGGAVKTIRVPARLQPDVAYAAAVVKGGDEAAARRFLDGMIDGEGAADLRRAGFLPPP